MRPFRDRLAEPRPVLLDGATGTELNRRGVDTSLPLWSAAALRSAPEVVRQIHADYIAAGAEVVTANTFRTHERNRHAAGIADLRRGWPAALRRNACRRRPRHPPAATGCGAGELCASADDGESASCAAARMRPRADRLLRQHRRTRSDAGLAKHRRRSNGLRRLR